jgi:hypothetical protein
MMTVKRDQMFTLPADSGLVARRFGKFGVGSTYASEPSRIILDNSLDGRL